MEQKRAISRPNSSSYDLVGCYIIIVSKIISFKKKSQVCVRSPSLGDRFTSLVQSGQASNENLLFIQLLIQRKWPSL